jgi:LysM repeat protein
MTRATEVIDPQFARPGQPVRAQANHIAHPQRRAVADEHHASRGLSTGRVALGLLLTVGLVLLALNANEQRQDDPTPTATAESAQYLVRSGDTISSVADLHGISVDRLMEANGLTRSDSLDPGSRLDIPEMSTDGRSPPAELLADQAKLTYAPLFEEAARQHELPPGLLEALAWHESAWVNARVDENERLGLGQLRPEIIDFLRREVVDVPLDSRVPEDNITLTAAYLGHLLEASEGDRAAALAGYYLGLETPAGGIWDLDVVGFVRDVLILTPDFAGSVAPAPTGSPTTSAGA